MSTVASTKQSQGSLNMDIEPGTSIVAAVEQNPALVLISKERFDAFYDAIREECETHTPDLSTASGRKAIASLAFKVARTKTAIDDAGKLLNSELREKINVVDAARRDIRDRLDKLKDEVRAPLTAWEQREETRKKKVAEAFEFLASASDVDRDATVGDVNTAIENVRAMAIDPDVFQERYEVALQQRQATIEHLVEIKARIERAEAERAELERLRAQAAAREEADRLAAQRAADAERERQRQEEARIAAEQAEQERVERERQAAIQAAEKARAEAQRVALAEQEERDRQHRAELAAIQAERDAAEAARQAEIERHEAEERRQQEAREKEAAEQRRREADRSHRSAVMKAAKEALMEHAKLDEDGAKRAVLAISGAHVPAVSIRF